MIKLLEALYSAVLYGARRRRTWAFFAILFAVAFMLARTAGSNAVHANSPYSIAQMTVLTSVLWVLISSAVGAGDAPGGRFLAVFVLNALILLAVPLALVTATYLPGMDPRRLGPFQPAAYLTAYAVLALPTVFTFTALQFSLAALRRRTVVTCVGSLLVFVGAAVCGALAINVLQMPALGQLLDPTCRLSVLVLMEDTLTPDLMNTRLIGLDSSILANRLLWICAASVLLAFTRKHVRLDPSAS